MSCQHVSLRRGRHKRPVSNTGDREGPYDRRVGDNINHGMDRIELVPIDANDTCHKDGPMPPRDDAVRGALPAEQLEDARKIHVAGIAPRDLGIK